MVLERCFNNSKEAVPLHWVQPLFLLIFCFVGNKSLQLFLVLRFFFLNLQSFIGVWLKMLITWESGMSD